MADSPSQAPTPASVSDIATPPYWCHQCNKLVSVETLPDHPDIICDECKNGFVELISVSGFVELISASPSFTSYLADDSIGSLLLQMLAREEDSPPPPPQDHPQSEDDFLRIELDGWDNDEEDEDDEDDDENEESRNRGLRAGEGGDDGSENENEENREEHDEEDMRRRRRDLLRLPIRGFATRARSGRNRILDWAEILMGLEDNSIEFRLEVPESDRFIGNAEDYVDAAGYEALLQNLAESDGGRRGAPPASKSAVSALPTVEITSEEETLVCAICKDMINVGDKETKLPCGHGYHGDCIVPWLGSRNSCPVCRFELPTDDVEYEEEKRKKGVAATFVGGASGSGGDNSGSN